MKKNEKIFIGILVTITIIAIVICIAVTKNKNNNDNTTDEGEEALEEKFVQMVDEATKLNISSKLNEAKTVNGIEIKNIQLTYRNGMTVLLADVTNNSGKDLTDVTDVDITLLGENNEEIITAGALISPTKAGETTQLNTSITMDYVNAYDFKVTIK